MLRQATAASESFVLSMALWKQGREAQARDAYRMGTEWIAQADLGQVRDYRMLLYESEAAALLGVPESERPGQRMEGGSGDHHERGER